MEEIAEIRWLWIRWLCSASEASFRSYGAGADDAEGVRLVDHQQRVELVAHLAQFGQRGDVAVHGVDAVDDDQPDWLVDGDLYFVWRGRDIKKYNYENVCGVFRDL